jgi:ribosomal protein S18 acetylase RimI-like enzyme
MNIVPADSFSDAELADLFTRGYEGYYVPVQVDDAALRFMIESWDIDLSRSRVAEGLGLCNLGVRGDRGWIGGIAVLPAARRQGIGRSLLEAVLDVAPATVTLEVLEQNEPAIRLYETLGFERTRILEVWSVKETPLVEARSADPAPVGGPGLPWQREDASLPPGGYQRLELDGGAVLVRGTNILQLGAPDEDTAAALLSRGTPVQFVNVPEGDVASSALRRLGGELTLRQLEMALVR